MGKKVKNARDIDFEEEALFGSHYANTVIEASVGFLMSNRCATPLMAAAPKNNAKGSFGNTSNFGATSGPPNNSGLGINNGHGSGSSSSSFGTGPGFGSFGNTTSGFGNSNGSNANTNSFGNTTSGFGNSNGNNTNNNGFSAGTANAVGKTGKGGKGKGKTGKGDGQPPLKKQKFDESSHEEKNEVSKILTQAPRLAAAAQAAFENAGRVSRAAREMFFIHYKNCKNCYLAGLGLDQYHSLSDCKKFGSQCFVDCPWCPNHVQGQERKHWVHECPNC
jgi:hypothetical protein